MNSSNKAKTAGLLFFLFTILISSSSAQTKQETQDWIVEKLNYTACEQVYWNKKLDGDQRWWHWNREASDFSVRGDTLFFIVKNKYSNEWLLRFTEKSREDYYCKCSICTQYRSNKSTATYVSIPLNDLDNVDYSPYNLDLAYEWNSDGTSESKPNVGTLKIICNKASIAVKGDITGTNSRERIFYLSDYPVRQRTYYISIDKEKDAEILPRLTKAFNHLKTLYPKKKEIF